MEGSRWDAGKVLFLAMVVALLPTPLFAGAWNAMGGYYPEQCVAEETLVGPWTPMGGSISAECAYGIDLARTAVREEEIIDTAMSVGFETSMEGALQGPWSAMGGRSQQQCEAQEIFVGQWTPMAGHYSSGDCG
jgi:hypothetical protein